MDNVTQLKPAFSSFEVQTRLMNLFHAASKDATRPQMQGVWLDYRNAKAIATDGHIMVWQAIEKSDNDPIFIESRIAENILKSKCDTFTIGCDGTVNYAGIQEKSSQSNKIFAYQSVMHFLSDVTHKLSKEEIQDGEVPWALNIGLNPWLFVRVAKALGRKEKGRGDTSPALKIRLSTKDRPAIVYDNGEPSALIMPVRL